MDNGLPASLLAVLDRRQVVSQVERNALASVSWRMQSIDDGQEIIPEGLRTVESCILVKGISASVRYLASGDRQLTTLHVPGDFLDLHGLFLKVLDHGVLALTDCQVAFVRHDDLRRIAVEHPAIAEMFSTRIARELAIQRMWIVCMGRRDPVRRIAHLLCEMYLRLHRAGQAEAHRFELPITQAELADLAGLSVVHTNRALQELRSTGLVIWQGTAVVITNWTTLTAFAGFDQTYLALDRQAS
jgi:CRP-like cAMP-binding protein